MIRNYYLINNEDGSVIVLAILILAILTILGISSTNTSVTELQIVKNEQIYQTNFNLAESAVYEATQRIEDETNTEQLFPDITGYDWINNNTVNLSIPANWNDLGPTSGNANDNCDQSLISPNALYGAIALGIKSGSSLDIGATRLYKFAVFGLAKSTVNGGVLIEIGYLKRF